MKKIVKLTPQCKDIVWGGNKLREYGKISSSPRIAETWEVSMHQSGLSLTENGKSIEEEFGKTGLGKNVKNFEFFPVLVKFIDAADNLSVQVHPSDEYALKNEGEYGKTEMWRIVEADSGAGIYLGFKRDTDKEEFLKAVENGTVLELLNFFPVKKGETYFIKAGTVHAIGKGVTLCEIQQNSNLTYRIYDYKRKGADGKERELHLDKALKVIDFNKFELNPINLPVQDKELIGASKYFSTYFVSCDGEKVFDGSGESFTAVSVLSGSGEIEGKIFNKGDTFMLSAKYGNFTVKGKCEMIFVSVRKYFVGIDIGGTFIKGGLVDDLGNIVVSGKVATESKKGYEFVEKNIAALVNRLIEGANLSKSDVVGVGMGVPGMIDGKNGKVVYSNNIKWKDVCLVDDISALTGMKVKIANDANTAALGESTFGIGQDYDDCVLITLGTGVGGGIIVGNKLVEGNKCAGAELGHMVIVEGGEQCTCGRKGCFEAYCSATALIRDTKRAMTAHKDSKMWEIGDIDKVDGATPFNYAKTDKYAKEVVDNYIEKLGCGIANIANIFRPHVVILGGGVCAQGDNLIKPLQKIVDREIFGGVLGPMCPVTVTKLGNRAGTLGAAALFMSND